MIVKAFLVLARGRHGGRRVTARRVTQRRPWLDVDEALVQLVLDLPDDLFDAPLITVPVERRAVAVGVEVGDPVEESA